jgi:hypothetical protein
MSTDRTLAAPEPLPPAIAIVNHATLLTRNASDFGQIAELKIEDGTAQSPMF